MKRLILMFGQLVPYFRRYAKLQKEEDELHPKVKAGIKSVMANGDSDRRKAVTDKVKEKMTECGL